ncbi:zf-HC2 domain-containing protein [Micromonospora sp. NPDC049559]|uniref:zf-HC2 domain-containing protein n=1 Tax=Micromonospora sp. NPDC049559 TaxID=3155923 RepID=UPI00342FC36B
MTREEHWDVASYALGVLDERDAERFEEHLAECWVCAGELESLLPVVDLLADVDGDDLATVEKSTSDGQLLDRMLVTVGRERHRARSRQLYALAAGVVALLIFSGVALFAGTRLADPPRIDAQPSATASATTGPDEPFPSGEPGPGGQPGPGIGGPEVEGGQKVTATDGGTGVRADLILDSAPFGTQISFALTKLPGPRTCRLVVLRRNGTSEVLSSWSVPAGGYGTAARPQPLLLQVSTSTPRAEIDRVQVQSVDPSGVATPLVTVPL